MTHIDFSSLRDMAGSTEKSHRTMERSLSSRTRMETAKGIMNRNWPKSFSRLAWQRSRSARGLPFIGLPSASTTRPR